MPQSSNDIYDPDIYAEGVPHETFRRLRQESPVYWQALEDGGYWALLRHADVLAASKNWETFSAARGGIIIEEQTPEMLEKMRTQLLSMDPPEHLRMRRTVLDAFTPRLVQAMEPFLRKQAIQIMQMAQQKRDCDFVKDLANELPLQVIAEMMAIPESERARLVELADGIIGRDDPDFAPVSDATDPTLELGLLGFELAQQRKAEKGSDLISLLLTAEFEGHALTEVEFAALFVQIAVAANETTRTLLSGGLLALIEHPEAFRRLHDAPKLLPVAIEEMLRWVTPVHYFRRTATREIELHGKTIREGDRVALLYTSANFDETVFDQPERFDIARNPNPHVSFGFGEHFCLGARLARLEVHVFFDEFFKAFDSVELTGTPKRLRSNMTNSLKSMPIRLTARN